MVLTGEDLKNIEGIVGKAVGNSESRLTVRMDRMEERLVARMDRMEGRLATSVVDDHERRIRSLEEGRSHT